MKKLKRLSMVAVLLSATIFAVSCEEEESSSVNNSNCYDGLEELANTLVSRSNTFSANPTSSNCNSLRTSALNLLDAAEDCDEYGYLFEEQAQFWIEYDCSLFD